MCLLVLYVVDVVCFVFVRLVVCFGFVVWLSWVVALVLRYFVGAGGCAFWAWIV